MTDELLPQLEHLIPEGGSAYSNEGDLHERDWKKVFWGSNYNRLLHVKQKYDPKRLLYALHTVGSDAWTPQEDGRLCRTSNHATVYKIE